MATAARLGLLCALGALLVSGCGGGGGGASRYNKPTFVACLNQHGVPTQDLSNPVTAADKAVAALLKPISPNMIAAKFPDGFVGVAFASSSAGAARILAKFKQLMKSPSATPGKVQQVGSLVILTNPHTTAGTQKTLAACESSAAIH